MATRDYQTQLNPVQRQDIQVQGGLGVHAAGVTPNQDKSAILAGLGSTISQLGGQLLQQSIEKEYLRGQQARMEGQAFDTLDSNPIMKPFLRGGYQSQDAQLELASFQDDMNSYIQSDGYKQDPSQFQETMAKRSQNLLSSYGQGMSVEDRARMLQATTNAMQTATQTHAAAWGQHQIQQHLNTQYIALSTNLRNIQDAKASGNPEATSSAYTGLLAQLQTMGQGLPEDQAIRLQSDALNTIAAQEPQLVQQLDQSGKLDIMSPQDRARVFQTATQALTAQNSAQQYQYAESDAAFDSQASSGTLTYQQAKEHADELHARGQDKQLNPFWDKYAQGAAKSQSSASLVNAYTSNNTTELTALGKSLQDGANEYDESMAKQGIPASQRQLALLRTGFQNGTMPTQVGQNFNNSLSRLATQQGTDEDTSIVVGTLNAVAAGSSAGNSQQALFLSGIAEKDRPSAMNLLSQMRGIENPTADDVTRAMVAVKSQADAYTASSSTQKASMNTKLKAAVTAEIQNNYAGGFLRQQWNSLPWVGGNQLRSADETNLMQAMQGELQTVMNDPAKAQYLANQDPADVANYLMSQVKSKVVEIPSGSGVGGYASGVSSYLIMNPAARSPFKTQDTQAIGQQLSNDAKAHPNSAKDTYWNYSQRADGSIVATEFNAQNMPMLETQRKVDTDAMNENIQRESDSRVRQSHAVYSGQSVKVNGGSVGLTGHNTAGIDPDAMFRARQGLAGDEGVRYDVYKDTEGNLTVGMGHKVLASDNLKFGDVISQSQVDQMAADDSDKAARVATRYAAQQGITDQGAILAMFNLAFQGGEGMLQDFTPSIQAARDGNLSRALYGVLSSEWAKQTPNRAINFARAMVSLSGQTPKRQLRIIDKSQKDYY